MTALLNLVKAAVFAALIAVMTAYIKFNTGINDGYLHFGDSMIYLPHVFFRFRTQWRLRQ